MSWTDLEPIVKTTPRAQASCYVNKDTKVRMRLFLSEAMLNDVGHPKAANIQIGLFDDVVKLRLAFDAKGKFKLHDLKRAGARILNIPGTAATPDGGRESEPCDVESADKKEAVIVLPLQAWERQIAPPRPLPQRPAAPAASAPKPNGNGASGHVETRKSPDLPLHNGRFDAVAYLANKGVKISRKGDGYMIDGELTSKASTLVTVNRYRRAAELPDLKLVDIE